MSHYLKEFNIATAEIKAETSLQETILNSYRPLTSYEEMCEDGLFMFA